MRPTRLCIWPPLPLRLYTMPPVAGRLPFPLDAPGCRIFSAGRHALAAGVRSLGIEPGAQVLAPAYNHGSGTESLLSCGVESVFYEGTERLEPDEDELERLLGPRVRALSLIHYLGFPQNARRWRRWCDEHGLFLIEDCAQAWLAEVDGTPVGSHGDIAMFCLYKTFGLPDGAALVSNGAPVVAPARRPLGIISAMRRHGAWLASRSSMAAELMELVQHEVPYNAELEFALGDVTRGPTEFTLRALASIADQRAAATRRANYARLLTALGALVPPPFETLPAGASPFVFPIEADDPPQMLRRLRTRGIVAAAFWSAFHPAIDKRRFPRLVARRAHTVALPVHQELTSNDLDRIIDGVLTPQRRPAHRIPTSSPAGAAGGVAR